MPVQTSRRSPSPDQTEPPGRTGTTVGKSTRGGKRARRKDPLWARLALIMGAVLLVSSGVAIVGSKVVINQATSGIEQENLLGDAGKSDAEGGKDLEGPINMLLLGVDVRGAWGPENVRADTIIVLHIPASHDQAYLVSIPRDTEVQVPASKKSGWGGGTAKINSAFEIGAKNGAGWAGGAQMMAATIKNLTGISFDGAAIINFEGFKKVIDALGSVHLCVDQEVTSYHMKWVDGKPMWNSDAERSGKPMKPIVHKKGCRDMKGWEALDFSRQRYGLKNGDYDRQQHQQQLIKAMAKKAMDSGVITNPIKLNGLVKSAGEAFVLDTGGTPVADFVFTMRGVAANDLVMLRTNDGHFNSVTEGAEEREVLKPISLEMFKAVRDDKLADFIAANPNVISTKK
ncbi:LCP family protein [Micromonospora sp. NBC_01699]|uniref:LCP family protein n=1 Tax=Micromonospora sp. NBC_01699 TaxID=2975984 RepID=UPI002E2DF01B|nr:LCP family protein [Micromonospora sp. NBC_01699]